MVPRVSAISVDGQLFAEYLDPVAGLAVDVGHVDHAHVHADVAHDGGPLAVHHHAPFAVAQVAVQSVGIADGNGGDA